MKINIHLHPSTLLHASRINKITGWLIEKQVFDRVVTLGLLAPGVSAVQRTGKGRCFVRLPCQQGSNARWVLKGVYRLFWFVRVLFVARRLHPACINAHSLSVLPCAVLMKWLCGAKLVYDTHELETEVKTATGLRKRLVKIVERVLIPFADQTIVVSDSIADWYQQAYAMPRPCVVRNIPDSIGSCTEPSTYLREHFSIPEDDIIALYIGGLIPGRGLTEILEAWKSAPPSWHLVIVGFGPLLDLCCECAKLNPQIHFHPAVPSGDVVSVASSADLGFSLLEPCCLSHAYALPNKLFECLLAGLPVVSNGLPEIKAIIERDQCGWVVPLNELTSLFKIEKAEIQKKAALARQAAARYSWNAEAMNLIKPYKALGFEVSLQGPEK